MPSPSGSPQYPQYRPAAPDTPQGYRPYAQYGAPGSEGDDRSGPLLAAGVVAVILAIFVSVIGLGLLLIGDAVDSLGGELGSAVRLVGLVVLAYGAIGMVGGIGAIIRRRWGQVVSLVFGVGNLALGGLGLTQGRGGGLILYLAMSIAIIVLCVVGTPRGAAPRPG